MAGTFSSASSSSSSASFGSFDDVAVKASSSTVKLLCSYGGMILPRYLDGKLRYVGGVTRVLAVDRSLPFSELQVKLGELCGCGSVSLRCQLPTEDLDDALVSVTSDEDLTNLFEEYDLASRDRLLPLKIRAFLFLQPSKAPGPSSNPPPSASVYGKSTVPPPMARRCVHQISAPMRSFPSRTARDQRFRAHHAAHGSTRPHQHMVHHGNHWQ